MAVYTALLDANVIYSIPVTDLVLELASTGLFRARWSDAIHDEWVRNVAQDRPDLSKAQINARREAMDRAIPQALVTGYHDVIGDLNLPDSNDRHVLAAAIVGRADVIVTFNLKDFPIDALAPYGIEAQHPDEFLNFQRTLDEPLFLECVKQIRSRLSKPNYTPEAFIENLRSCQLQVIADELSKAKGLI
ncbi:MAG: PIN domain-containing protein [Alphaproteobacteria bacterium]|nr:PIN domain-containing protein [Alphaproteobacteria bacterium]